MGRGPKWKPGDRVRSTTGSDTGTTYLFVGEVVENGTRRALLWDGRRHRVDGFKKKNFRHLETVQTGEREALQLVNAAQNPVNEDHKLRLDAAARKICKKE